MTVLRRKLTVVDRTTDHAQRWPRLSEQSFGLDKWVASPVQAAAVCGWLLK